MNTLAETVRRAEQPTGGSSKRASPGNSTIPWKGERSRYHRRCALHREGYPPCSEGHVYARGTCDQADGENPRSGAYHLYRVGRNGRSSRPPSLPGLQGTGARTPHGVTGSPWRDEPAGDRRAYGHRLQCREHTEKKIPGGAGDGPEAESALREARRENKSRIKI